MLALSIVAGGLVGLNVKPIRIANQIGWPFFPFDPTKIWHWIDIGEPITDQQREKCYERWWGWPLALEKPWYWDLDGDGWPEFEIVVLWNFNFVTCLGLIAWTIYFFETKVGNVAKTKQAQFPPPSI